MCRKKSKNTPEQRDNHELSAVMADAAWDNAKQTVKHSLDLLYHTGALVKNALLGDDLKKGVKVIVHSGKSEGRTQEEIKQIKQERKEFFHTSKEATWSSLGKVAKAFISLTVSLGKTIVQAGAAIIAKGVEASMSAVSSIMSDNRSFKNRYQELKANESQTPSLENSAEAEEDEVKRYDPP